ncbi:hypothetical protein TNCV_1889361 [Trichonephila clavipes]|nr:hypothetical protein TNCV_1889361 [Trichonephila clavipes]
MSAEGATTCDVISSIVAPGISHTRDFRRTQEKKSEVLRSGEREGQAIGDERRALKKRLGVEDRDWSRKRGETMNAGGVEELESIVLRDEQLLTTLQHVLVRGGHYLLQQLQEMWEIGPHAGFFNPTMVLQFPAFVWPFPSSDSSSSHRLLLSQFSPDKRGL